MSTVLPGGDIEFLRAVSRNADRKMLIGEAQLRFGRDDVNERMLHLIDSGYLEHAHIEDGGDEITNGIYLTAQGLDALVAARKSLFETWWTRGLSIGAISIALGSLVVSIIALLKA